MRIYEELQQDHEKVLTLMEEISKTTEGSAEKRSKLLQSLKELLLSHIKAKEGTFYRSLIEHTATHRQALEALEEHKVAESVVEDLEEVDPSDERWIAKFEVLRAGIKRHFDEEEKETFTKAKTLIGQESAKEMGKQFHDLRNEVIVELKAH